MPAESTYTPLATTTLSVAAANIDFQNITSAHTDLLVVAFVRSSDAATTVNLLSRVNNASGNIYDGAYLRGSGTTASSFRYNDTSYAAPVGTMHAASVSSVFSQHLIHYFSYSNTNMNKTMMALTAAEGVTSGTVDHVINQYFSTAAISRLTFFPSAGNFVAGSTITIYGIKAA